MADAGRHKSIQAAHTSNYISFGHYGTAGYDSDSKQWSFLRDPYNETANPPFTLVKDPVRVLKADTDSNLLKHAESKFHSNHFLKLLPDAAIVTAGNENNVSLRSKRADERISPSVKLAFGNALVLGGNDIRAEAQGTPIAAYVDSMKSDKLILMLLVTETIFREIDTPRQVQVPCIETESIVSWTSSNGSIQQIHFSPKSSFAAATWLALRQHTATTIFQPLYYRRTTLTAGQTSLDINPIIKIPITRSGGLQHADVSFHPQDSRKFAIIDIGGNWSIWTTTGTRARSAHILVHCQLRCQGSFVSQPGLLQQFDGWYRLAWTRSNESNTDQLLIVNRQSLALVDTYGHQLAKLDVRVGQRKEGWTLDLVPGLIGGEYLILTTSHVFLITTNIGVIDVARSIDSENISVLAYWSHFRGHDDATLQLHVIRLQNAILLFLASNHSDLTTVYTCSWSTNGSKRQFCLSDPVLFDAPYTQGKDATILAVEVVQALDRNEGGEKFDVGYFKLFYQDLDRAIFEATYEIDLPGEHSTEAQHMIPLPKQRVLLHKTAHYVADAILDEEIDDFVVADNTIAVPSEVPTGVDVITFELSELVVGAMTRDEQQRICDLRQTYDFIVSQSVPLNQAANLGGDNILHVIKGKIEDINVAQTLFEITRNAFKSDIVVSDIEDESQMLNDWLQAFNLGLDSTDDAQHLAISRIAETRSLIEIYNDLVQLWMSPLSDTIPDRMRVQRERLLRQVALETYLSSIMVKPTVSNDLLHEKQIPWDLSDTATAIRSQPPLQLDEISPSSPTQASSQIEPEHPNLTHHSILSQYVQFKQPEPPSAKESSLINNILAHLPTSTDVNPDDYSYSNTELNLSLAEHDLLSKSMDPKARRKAKKLEQARKKQLDKQAQQRKVAFEQTVALPSVMSSQLPIRGVQSSQLAPAGSSQNATNSVPSVSMTQPERGVFGNRDVKKGKAKEKSRRQKGF